MPFTRTSRLLLLLLMIAGSVYTLARTTFKHPAWGWQHSERNYRIAMQLAQGDNLTVDTDVLFAMISSHVEATASPRGKWVLENWENMLPKFVKVFPHEYKRVLGIARQQVAVA